MAVIQVEEDQETVRWTVSPTNDIQGVSTRAVDDLVRAMGLSGTSKSQVSRLCEAEPSSAIGPRTMAKDERVTAFLNRPLEGDWPFLWLDVSLT
jgi:transposase-like protein